MYDHNLYVGSFNLKISDHYGFSNPRVPPLTSTIHLTPYSSLAGGMMGPPPGSKRPADMRSMGPPPAGPHNPAKSGGSSSKKKKRLADKILPQKVRELVPESQAYMDLLAFERKLDSTIMRKRLDIQVRERENHMILLFTLTCNITQNYL